MMSWIIFLRRDIAQLALNEIYHKIENMDEGIDRDEIVKDWMHHSTFAVREDFYRKDNMKHLRTLSEIIPFDPEDLLRQFTTNQAKYLPRELAVLLDDPILGKIHQTYDYLFKVNLLSLPQLFVSNHIEQHPYHLSFLVMVQGQAEQKFSSSFSRFTALSHTFFVTFSQLLIQCTNSSL
jgi:hypothetical protein